MKILVTTIQFPFPPTGACQMDRAFGILQLKRLGFEVKVIAKIAEYQSLEEVRKVSIREGIEIIPVSYKFDTKFSKARKLKEYVLRFFRNPLVLDGSASEFDEPEIKKVFQEQVEGWKPDLAWFDTTYTWPLYSMARRHKIPIVVRSLNFEPKYFLEENGYGLINLLRVFPKHWGEKIAVRNSDLVFAITPRETEIYKGFGGKNIVTLPLRALPRFLKKEREVREKERLDVFFMGSTYNVFHMRAAAELILSRIVPLVREKAAGEFFFHILGAKFPDGLKKYLGEDAAYEGYVGNLDLFLQDMDIALVPSLYGAGMQQKIFEPLCRGIPTITSPRGLAGYPFENGKNVLLAGNHKEFAEQLLKCRDIHLREELSRNSLKTCSQLFSQEKLDFMVMSKIKELIKC